MSHSSGIILKENLVAWRTGRTSRMREDDRLALPERVRTCEPTHREVLAVTWLAVFVQGLEAFVLLIGGPLLPLLFIVTSGILASLLFRWLRALRYSDRKATLFTSIAAAVVPWMTVSLFRANGFAEVDLILGLVSPYALVAALSPFLTSYRRA
jgi:hypothetical protein